MTRRVIQVYNIKFIRSGQRGKINRSGMALGTLGAKGTFNRSFNSLSELAKYLITARHVYLASPKSALTKSEWQSLHNKYSILKQRKRQSAEQ